MATRENWEQLGEREKQLKAEIQELREQLKHPRAQSTIPANDHLAQLLLQEKQLNARIQLAENRLSKAKRKERAGKLVVWGVAVEQLIADGTLNPEWLKCQFQRVLSGRNLERALVDEMT